MLYAIIKQGEPIEGARQRAIKSDKDHRFKSRGDFQRFIAKFLKIKWIHTCATELKNVRNYQINFFPELYSYEMPL